MTDAFATMLESGTRGAKKFVAATALMAVGVAFELSSKWDEAIQHEIEDWTPGVTFAMGVLPDGPFMTVQKEGKHVRYIGLGRKDPDVAICFKNLDAALLVFTGQIGTHLAAAEKRFLVQGDLTETVKISRTLSMVQAYVFPGLIVRKTFKRPPVFTPKQKWIKAKVYAALMPLLAARMTKKV